MCVETQLSIKAISSIFVIIDQSWFTLKLPNNAEVGAPLNVSVSIEYENKVGIAMPLLHVSSNGTTTTPEMGLVVEGDEKVELNQEVNLTLTAHVPENMYGNMELMVRNCIIQGLKWFVFGKDH